MPDEYHWNSALREALEHNGGDTRSRYFQLATVDEEGLPANRTLVFRGFTEDGETLRVATDTRSAKCAQLQDNATAELCWYFGNSREQFRIRCRARLFGATQDSQRAREALWRELSAAAREQFFWPAPGAESGSGTTPVAQAMPDSFSLLELAPLRVDHLQLLRPQQRRWLSEHDGRAWRARLINP